MNPRPWTSHHRDALLTRVTVLTAGTAVLGAMGAVGLGVGLAATTHVTAKKTSSSATVQPALAGGDDAALPSPDPSTSGSPKPPSSRTTTTATKVATTKRATWTPPPTPPAPRPRPTPSASTSGGS